MYPRRFTHALLLALLAAVLGCSGNDEGQASGAGGDGGGATGGSSATGGTDGSAVTTEDIIRLLRDTPLPLVSAQAFVHAGGRNYQFQLLWVDPNGRDIEEPGLLVGGCGVFAKIDANLDYQGAIVQTNFAAKWPLDASDRFSLWTPDGFPAGGNSGLNDGGPLVGGDVQLGLFDVASGKEWSAVPGGESSMVCVRASLPSADEPEDVYTCEVAWAGAVSENFSSEKSAGLARVSCIFASKDSRFVECLEEGCDDGNFCTYDFCSPVVGACVSLPIDRLFDGPSAETVENVEWLEALSRVCGPDGGGVCLEGECLETPCEENCSALYEHDSETRTTTLGTCSVDTDPPQCVEIVVTDVSG